MYSCSFTEESDPSTLKPTKHPEPDLRTDDSHDGYDEPPFPAKGSTCTSVKGMLFSPSEDELIASLKEKENLSWSEIAMRFPERTKGSLQVRYCTGLKHRMPGNGGKQPGQAGCRTLKTASSERSQLDSDPVSCFAEGGGPSQRYGPPRSRRAVDRYSPA